MTKVTVTAPVTHRKIYEIAREIRLFWPKPYFGAVPYLEAMYTLTDKNSKYFEDSADSIVRYFLANAQTFKGEAAKSLKAELKAIIGVK